MKSRILHLGLFALLLVIVSCGPSLKVSNDYDHAADFSNYKTYSMYDVKAKEGQINPLNADRILNAIKAEMAAKGFTEVQSNPDVMVNAMTFVKNKQSVTASSNYYGYGGMYRPYGYYGGGIGMASGTTTYNTYDYKDGSLFIDVVDTKTQKLVWQGVANAEFEKAPKDPQAFLTNAVKKVMADFPPKSKK